jgi:hypothetical protein
MMLHFCLFIEVLKEHYHNNYENSGLYGAAQKKKANYLIHL